MKNSFKNTKSGGWLRPCTTGIAALSISGAASAISIDTGVSDLEVYWDNTVRANLGWRAESRDDAFGNSPGSDEGNYKFDRGDMVTQRLDVLTELDVIWKRDYGFRISASGWYDNAYKDTDVEQNPIFSGSPSSYTNNEYSNYTERYYRGPSGEILDAFVFANPVLGEMPVSIKAGQFTSFWGMSTFYAGGISANQHPLDLIKNDASPGLEVKELFLPLQQVWASVQLAPTFSIEAQYYLDWDSTRISEGGTYLGAADFLANGPDQTALGTLNIPRLSPIEPEDDHGNWGVAFKWSPEFLQGQTIGLYYREYDEKSFQLLSEGSFVPIMGVPTFIPTAYRTAYTEDAKTFGLSFDGQIGALSVGAELGYHKDRSLSTVAFTPSSVGAARGDAWFAVANTIYLLPSTALWDTGTLVAELSYERLDKITENRAVYNGVGEPGCVNLATASGTAPTGVPGSGSAKDGCATRGAWGASVSFTPQWLQVLPGVDLSTPIFVTTSLDGTSAVGSGVFEGFTSYSIGLQADYRSIHQFSLRWDDRLTEHREAGGVAVGGSGPFSTADRGRITLTYKVSI